jgi:hypothetical protein
VSVDTVYVQPIPWHPSPTGGALGRGIRHDSRSLAYEFDTSGLTLISARHTRRAPIFDQGDLGSCTGNAAAGILGTDPHWSGFTQTQQDGINEKLAVGIYSEATILDDIHGHYPPDDTGSDGLSVAKVLVHHGWSAGFLHTFTPQDALLTLGKFPFMMGCDWPEGFDSPDSSGVVKFTGSIRGGHEIEANEIDVANRLVWFCNSWGTSWGLGGRFAMSFDTLAEVLDRQGDVTIPLPMHAEPPAPLLDKPTAADVQLFAAQEAWRTTKDWTV